MHVKKIFPQWMYGNIMANTDSKHYKISVLPAQFVQGVTLNGGQMYIEITSDL